MMIILKIPYLHCLYIIDEPNNSLIMSLRIQRPCLYNMPIIYFTTLTNALLGVIYGSISLPGSRGQSLLESAVQKLLKSVNSLNEEAKALWSLRYTQLGRVSDDVEAGQATACEIQPNVFCFPPPSLDLAFDDGTIDLVKQAWRMIMGDEASEDEFMKFEDREVMNDEE